MRHAAPGRSAETIAEIRALIRAITVTPHGKRAPVGLEIEAELAALLSKDGRPSRGTVVAGARNDFCYNFGSGLSPAFRYEIEDTH